jgi:hypothetical protein
MSLEVIFGIPLDVAATYIVLFTIYGALLQYSVAGKFFLDWAMAALGRSGGAGPGRTATVAGGLLGMISGSGVATTVMLGSVAWPMLRRAGYPADVGGAILSAAGIGAIISPPTLGAAAFLIAEFLKVSYLQVLIMAAVPSLLSRSGTPHASLEFFNEILHDDNARRSACTARIRGQHHQEPSIARHVVAAAQIARSRERTGEQFLRRREREVAPVVTNGHVTGLFGDGDALAREHLVEHASKSPDIGALVNRPASRLFGAHIGGRPYHDSGLCQRRRRHSVCLRRCRYRIECFGEAEVEHLRDIRPEHNVRRFEISVHDAALMRRLRFVDERRRLKNVAPALSAHVVACETAQCIVNEMRQLFEGRHIPDAPSREQPRDILRGPCNHENLSDS